MLRAARASPRSESDQPRAARARRPRAGGPARHDRDRVGVRPDRRVAPPTCADLPRALAAGPGAAAGRVRSVAAPTIDRRLTAGPPPRGRTGGLTYTRRSA